MEMIKVFNDHTGEILEKTFVGPRGRGRLRVYSRLP